MIALSYITPEGDPIPVPTVELLREVIFASGMEYWGDSADACLGWVEYLNPGHRDLLSEPRLIFFYHEPQGFHFAYDAPGQPRLLTYNGSADGRKVSHYPGGEAVSLPEGCFVSRELAWQVVEDFLGSQQASGAVQWINASQLNFDNG